MGKFIDETGNVYSKLTVLSRAENPPGKSGGWWLCHCECGKEVVVLGTLLRNGNTRSCGCLQKEFAKSTCKNEIGNKYGSLTVISRGETPPNRKTAFWNCVCDCGKNTIVEGTKLRSGHTVSCGTCNRTSSLKINETGNTYGKLTVIEDAGRDKEGHALWRCLCSCGNEKITSGKMLRGGLVKSCGCMHSYGEEKIALCFTKMGVLYERQKTFEDCRNPKTGFLLYFDFYLPEQNLIIEFQGEQHYTSFEKGYYTKEGFLELQYRDGVKKEYCQQKNISLIEIPYFDIDKIDEKYLQEKILCKQ